MIKYRRTTMKGFGLFTIALLLGFSASAFPQDSASGSRSERLLVEAERALDFGQHAEAIELLIRADRLGSDAATARLQELTAAMSLQPADPWLDASGQQVDGHLADFEEADGIHPAVLATINLAAGRAAVADLPISFRAVSGSAELVSPVLTTDYGLANSRVLSITDPYEPLVVRAEVVFTVDGEPYALDGVQREFSYRAPLREASILIVVVDGDLARYQNRDTDRIAAALEPEGIRFVSLEELPDPGDIVVGPDNDSRPGPGPGAGPGSGAERAMLLVLAEVLEAQQITLGDRAFNLWQARVATSYRVVRAEDRRILKQLPGPRETGQGASRRAAVADALERAFMELENRMEANPRDYEW